MVNRIFNEKIELPMILHVNLDNQFYKKGINLLFLSQLIGSRE